MRIGIGGRAIGGVAAVIAATVGVTTFSGLKAQESAGLAELRRSGDQLGETIQNSTRQNMMEKHRDRLRMQFEAIGRQAGIETVRVYNKKGRIVFSSQTTEVGQVVNMRAQACDACHADGRVIERPSIPERSRVFRAGDGRRLLGIISPIPNSAGCSTGSCHSHDPDRKVLGVLDLTVSLAHLDAEAARSRRRMVLLALVAIGASSAILWWFNRLLVVRPVTALAAATHRVAAGDLATVVPEPGSHELGDLARSFNQMTRRLAEAQLQLTHADKLTSLGRMAAGIAHEINNPLTGVLTYSSFLLKRTQDSPALAADLEVIVRETKRCREIVRRLLDFARQGPPERQTCELNAIVTQATEIVSHQLKLNRAETVLNLAEGLPPIQADAAQLQQVVVNLLVNAADALVDGGQVRLSTYTAGQSVEIAVEDTGHGISDADRAHIFDPFFTTKGTRGTGLGLSVSWGIVKAHRGVIEVTSEVGKGSRFVVRLPVGESS